MKSLVSKFALIAIFASMFSFSTVFGAEHSKGMMEMEPVSGGDSCIKCHKGIESIRDTKSDMMQQIIAMGQGLGDSAGCVVCHGGNPEDGTVKGAHKGAPAAHAGGLAEFVRDPGSMWIADKTCGICHADTVENTMKSLMMTEAGKIQGNMHSWGTYNTKKVQYANYDVKDKDGKTPAWGTKVYKDYMIKMIDKYPNQFPTELKQLPLPPSGPEDFAGKSEDEIAAMASITYQRSDCQRCHIGVRGRKGRGDWRGMGCSACHIPYGNEGIYEGKDPTINKKENGHLLVHMIQGTREAKVKTPSGMEFSGIHPETCNSCHNRGKRIGVSYVGLMEQPYGSPLNVGGKSQSKHHGKRYKHIKEDLHFEAGMTCQDCHTSVDMHGDGTLFGTTLGQVEIECSDCHGTNDKYPWELKIGFGENFKIKTSNKARGMAEELPYWMTQGTVYDKQGGYLLSTRGNPLGNVVKVENKEKVIVHLASGKDLEVPLLKYKAKTNTYKSKDAHVAMGEIKAHMENLECYSCHSDWAPQCYGCHVKVDYTPGKSQIDWIASGSSNFKNGETSESILGTKGKKLFGKPSETRSYLRWEDPILGINGENLVTPVIPGCQVTFTVIGPDGKTLILNKQARVDDNGQNVAGTDMSPVQPHTSGRKARSCESCHSNPKALGYGIQDGQFLQKQGEDLYMDLQDLRTGKYVPKNKTVQMKGIPGMDYDWSQIVTRDGKQLQTVGTHWPDSRPLDQGMRERMEKTGLCMGCHQNMSNDEIWGKLNTDKKLDMNEHIKKMHEIAKKAAKATK
ncbi:cytochrome C [Malaciobacter sp. WC5094]|uniref:cytochrome C n=1 Tax=Arcobacter sp. YIC-80 TaxID=3376683 RepID=UPI00384EBC8F